MTQACAIQSGTVWACSLTEPNGTPAKAVWNTAGSSSFIVGAGVYLNYKDLSGGTASISGAATSVPIGIQPILLEGATGAAGLPAAPTGLTATVQ